MAATDHYVGVLLAAGTGSRYRAAATHSPHAGAHKLLATLPDGRRVAQASAMTLLATLPTTLAVLGQAQTPVELSIALSALGCTIVHAPCTPVGMGVSLATAARYLLDRAATPTAPSGCVVALADMPWLRADTLTHLLSHAAPDRIVVPIFNGQRGHPVVFGARFLPELATLEGDTGARALLNRYGALEIECHDAGVVRDVDTPADLYKPHAI